MAQKGMDNYHCPEKKKKAFQNHNLITIQFKNSPHLKFLFSFSMQRKWHCAVNIKEKTQLGWHGKMLPYCLSILFMYKYLTTFTPFEFMTHHQTHNLINLHI